MRTLKDALIVLVCTSILVAAYAVANPGDGSKGRMKMLEARIVALEDRTRPVPAPESPKPEVASPSPGPEAAHAPTAMDRATIQDAEAGGSYVIREDAWDEFMGVCDMEGGEAQDGALEALERAGKIVMEQNGAEVRIDRAGISSCKVTVTSGDRPGFTGWIFREFLRYVPSRK